MQHELLSVVDENDRVIGVNLRQFVHALLLRHRAVHILVFNDQGWLFLQKRSRTKDLNPGLWDSSAAGHVDAGEDYDASAHREVNEELGIDAEGLIRFLFKLPASEATGMEFIQVYRCHHNGPFRLAPNEIEEGSWHAIDAVNARVRADDPKLTKTFKTLWRELKSRDK